MRDIDDFLTEVLVYAPNLNEPLAHRVIRDAARDLCFKARLWRERDSIQIDDPTYEGICTIQDADIVEIEQAKFNGVNLTPVTKRWLDGFNCDWQNSEVSSGAAQYVTQLNPNTVTVYPFAEGTLELGLILQPSLTATTMPDWLLDLHRGLIGQGAAARALLLPGENSNPTLGAGLQSIFESKVASAKTQSVKGQQGARLRTKGDYF
jgi:hypothetical protein